MGLHPQGLMTSASVPGGLLSLIPCCPGDCLAPPTPSDPLEPPALQHKLPGKCSSSSSSSGSSSVAGQFPAPQSSLEAVGRPPCLVFAPLDLGRPLEDQMPFHVGDVLYLVVEALGCVSCG